MLFDIFFKITAKITYSTTSENTAVLNPDRLCQMPTKFLRPGKICYLVFTIEAE